MSQSFVASPKSQYEHITRTSYVTIAPRCVAAFVCVLKPSLLKVRRQSSVSLAVLPGPASESDLARLSTSREVYGNTPQLYDALSVKHATPERQRPLLLEQSAQWHTVIRRENY